jgi:predicted RNA-binding Zn-ribbon protein involved in translation (DUF1610 family)
MTGATETHFKCPACGELYTLRTEADYSMSRYHPTIKICPPCGVREAFTGNFWTSFSSARESRHG